MHAHWSAKEKTRENARIAGRHHKATNEKAKSLLHHLPTFGIASRHGQMYIQILSIKKGHVVAAITVSILAAQVDATRARARYLLLIIISAATPRDALNYWRENVHAKPQSPPGAQHYVQCKDYLAVPSWNPDCQKARASPISQEPLGTMPCD